MCPDAEEESAGPPREEGSQQGSFIQPDDYDSFDDEANDVASERSSLTSLTASVLEGKVEGGRTYAVYGQEEYGMPMDDAELDRIDMCHTKYFALLGKRRFLAPVSNPHKILDLGCGTGIWSIDIADEFPNAEVIGVDIAPTQPQWVPPNCHFELDDIEKPWTWKDNSLDFIFARDLILAIRDWPGLIDQCFKALKPGGWVEFQCVTGILKCDDGTLPRDSSFQKFSDVIAEASNKWGTPIDSPSRWKTLVQDRGFSAVTEKVPKLPVNPWPKEPTLKLLGAWEMENLLSGVEGMVSRIFQKALGWSDLELQVFLANLRKDIKNVRYHTYWPYYVVYAQKPMSTEGDDDSSAS